MPFFHDPHQVILDGQLEKSYYLVGHELGSNCAATQAREFLPDEFDVLFDLDYANLVLSALGRIMHVTLKSLAQLPQFTR